jgi:hypothetical protein
MIGTTTGPYQVVHPLRQGRLATVYRAEHACVTDERSSPRGGRAGICVDSTKQGYRACHGRDVDSVVDAGAEGGVLRVPRRPTC